MEELKRNETARVTINLDEKKFRQPALFRRQNRQVIKHFKHKEITVDQVYVCLG